MTFEETVEYLLDTHPAQLTATERELLRPTMQQVALFLIELNISMEEYTSRFATPHIAALRYNIHLH